MKVEEATQTKDGTPVKIFEKRFNKVLGYWVDGFGNAHAAKWDSDGDILEGGNVCPAQAHDLRLDLHDWRDDIPWDCLRDEIGWVIWHPKDGWRGVPSSLAVGKGNPEPVLDGKMKYWYTWASTYDLQAVKMPTPPNDWHYAKAQRP